MKQKKHPQYFSTEPPLHQKLEAWEFAQHRVFILVYVLYAKELSSESGVYQSKDKF